MEIYTSLLENKELVKIIYGIIILLICLVIFLKTDKLFKLSSHQGIRLFRNAFFFFGLAFASRYLLPLILYINYVDDFLFELFLTIGGFFLLNSLIWKKFYYIEKDYLSSLFSPITILFYMMSVIIVVLDFFWYRYLFLFSSQILIFIFASIISYRNYCTKKARPFLKFYFAAMVLSLVAWILNALAALFFNWGKGFLINSYLLNIVVFFLFLFGVIKVTKK